MTSRRAAIVASAFWPHVGGVEELSRQLAIAQRDRGRTPVIVTMRWPTDLPAADVHDEIPLLRHEFLVPHPRPQVMTNWLLHSRARKRELVAQLRDRQVDLIHVQCVSNNARYALAAARDLDIPLVVSMQGELTMDATGLYQRSAYQRRSWRALLDAAAAVTGCSQSVLDDARRAYDGSWADRSSVVPNGVRVADFAAVSPRTHPRPYVLGIGRLVPQKGFDVLLRAIAVLVRTTEVDLVLAGDGPERTRLESISRELGIADRVSFVGSLGRSAAVAAFAGAVAFSLPSRIEPQGIVVLEAMASGVPVVASRVGGVPETVEDGVNGRLVAAADSAALAAALREVIDDRELASALIAAGRVTAASRDWSHIADQYDAIYGSVG